MKKNKKLFLEAFLDALIIMINFIISLFLFNYLNINNYIYYFIVPITIQVVCKCILSLLFSNRKNTLTVFL